MLKQHAACLSLQKLHRLSSGEIMNSCDLFSLKKQWRLRIVVQTSSCIFTTSTQNYSCNFIIFQFKCKTNNYIPLFTFEIFDFVTFISNSGICYVSHHCLQLELYSMILQKSSQNSQFISNLNKCLENFQPMMRISHGFSVKIASGIG